MATTNLTNMLQKAFIGGYAVGAFNINNDLQAQAIFRAAYELNSPLIVQASKGACVFQGEAKDPKNSTIKELTRGARRIGMLAAATAQSYPNLDYVLHLDHGANLDIVMACVESGFSSVMIDGSELDTLEKNINLTREVVKEVRKYGLEHKTPITVEGELGTLGGKSHSGGKGQIEYAQPSQVVDFVRETGIDALAIAWGTRHGANKGNGGELDLRPEVIGECKSALIDAGLTCYLVSHGSSTVPEKYVKIINQHLGYLQTMGIPKGQVEEAIRQGAVKVNIDTDLRLACTAEIRHIFDEKRDVIDPRDYLIPARQAMYEAVKECIQSFGSANKI